ncbi:hypothetical protein [Aureimonas sp. AU4]|uniref:hypothetical protein n=1 Tax=Aureimonas sp. AU4 TaxID=1638163 RepID=UPI000705B5FF|nr:hypothetical protein [Aureimonas sp. AU4]BAT30650.1 hypothetical protein [Aureimonas sp. AU4]
MDDEERQELSDRIDGLRLIIASLIEALPNSTEILWRLQQTEAMARRHNLPAGVLKELVDLRETLDEL